VVLKQDVEPGCFKYGVYTTFNPCKKKITWHQMAYNVYISFIKLAIGVGIF
jgi:hypothetical protein